MNPWMKRWWWIGAACLVFAAIAMSNNARSENPNPKKERVIKIVAKRFTYTPSEIVLKTGEPVRLEFTSLDFIHGFNVPDLNIRADLPPGQVTTVRLLPKKAGTYEFLCDNFCGAEHEDMHGKIVVKD